MLITFAAPHLNDPNDSPIHPSIHQPTSLVIVRNKVDLFISTGAQIIYKWGIEW